MAIKNYVNSIIDDIPLEKNPNFDIVIKDWSHYNEKINLLKKLKNWLRSDKKKKLESQNIKYQKTVKLIEISLEEWKKLTEYNHAIKIYNEFDISWSLLIDNLNQLQKFINTHITNKKIAIDFQKEAYLRGLNHKLINAISSLYVFYNNILGLSERNFDKETQDRIRDVFRNMYDKYLDYRFCYQLRGYVNHRHLPLDVLQSDLSTDEIVLNLNVQKLLNSSYNWNTKLKRELANVESISIKSIISNLFAAYFENYKLLSGIVKDELRPHTDIIETLGLQYNSIHTYTLRVIWDLDKIESIKNPLEDINIQEVLKLIKEKNQFNLIETNLNLTAYEVFNGRLGYTLAPEHFHIFHSNLMKNFFGD